MQNPINPFNFREIGSSSRIVEGNDYLGGEVGIRIIDPRTWDTYLRVKEIGSSSNGLCRIYRALHSKYSGELICFVLPYMSQGSIRYIISTHPYNNLPEVFIALFLLIRLRDNPRPHNNLPEDNILVHDLDYATAEMLIKLAFEASISYETENINWIIKFEESFNSEGTSSFLDPKSISKWGAAPEVVASENEKNRGPKSDIWLLGITALELAYGNLPVTNRRDLERIIKKVREKKKLPKSLEELLKKKMGFEKELDSIKRKKRVFSEEFEKMVLACLSENPEKRPSIDELLNAPFFTSAIEKFKQFVLN